MGEEKPKLHRRSSSRHLSRQPTLSSSMSSRLSSKAETTMRFRPAPIPEHRVVVDEEPAMRFHLEDKSSSGTKSSESSLRVAVEEEPTMRFHPEDKNSSGTKSSESTMRVPPNSVEGSGWSRLSRAGSSSSQSSTMSSTTDE